MKVCFSLFLIIWCVQMFDGKPDKQPGNHGCHDYGHDHDQDHPYQHIRNINYTVGIGPCPVGYWLDPNGKCREVYLG